MKTFVVMTYYQLMHSVAMALTLDEKPALYFSVNYLNVNDSFLERIRQTEIFDHVVGITARGDLAEFIAELNKTKDFTPEEVDEVGDSIFEKHLEPYYGELFKDADFDDTVYIYNDFQWYSYYVNKHFDDIVGVEDGYGSLEQQLKIHKYKGDQELVVKFLGKYYPEPLYKSPKIHKIISSKDFDTLPDEYRAMLQIRDFMDIVEENRSGFKDAMLHIFDMTDYEIEDNSVLVLGQPMSRAMYCNAIEEYMFYRDALREEVRKGKTVYFKGHPAETVPSALYEEEGIHILPKSFPVELLNYKDCVIDKAITFGSTGINNMECVKSFEKFYDKENPDAGEINAFLVDRVKDSEIIIDFYFMVRELTLESYIDVYSCMIPGNHLNQRTHVLVEPELEEEARQFFSITNLEKNARTYKKKTAVNGICINERNIDLILEQKGQLKSPEVIVCTDLESDDELLKITGEHHADFDYMMVVEEENLMFSPMRNIWKELKLTVRPGLFFQRFSMIENRKRRFPWVPLSPDYCDNVFYPEIRNTVWHRVAVERMLQVPEIERVDALFRSEFYPAKKFSNDLFVPSKTILSVEDGLKHYAGRVRKLVEICNNGTYEGFEEEKDQIIAYYAALELGKYMDWKEMSDGFNDNDAMMEFIEESKVSDRIASMIIATYCSTLIYEKRSRYQLSHGPNVDRERFLRGTIGMSRRMIRSAQMIKKTREVFKKKRR